MQKQEYKPIYPENAYCAIFRKEKYPDMPPDAEKTLEYVLATLSPRESVIFMYRFKEHMSFGEISEKLGNITRSRVSQILTHSLNRLILLDQTKILVVGLEVYLNTVAKENEEKRRRYQERIDKLKELIIRQNAEISELKEKAKLLCKWFLPTQEFLNTDIYGLCLTRRPFNCLAKSGLKTVKEILNYGDLSKLPNMGKSSVQEVYDRIIALMETVADKEVHFSDFDDVQL